MPVYQYGHKGDTTFASSINLIANGLLSDTANLPHVARAVRIGIAGTVRFLDAVGNEDTWTMPANSIIPGGVSRVFLTGTTATELSGLY